MTVLTMGSALAQALYTDTHRPVGDGTWDRVWPLRCSEQQDPVTMSFQLEYPASIRKLDTTARWLYALQDDIAAELPRRGGHAGE